MKYGNRSLWKKIISSPLSMIAAAILLAILAKAAWNISAKASASSARLEQAQIELAKVEARQNELSSRVNRLSSEQGIEAEIRTKYHAVKEGESVAVIVNESQTASVANASGTATTTSSPGWFGRMLQWLGF